MTSGRITLKYLSNDTLAKIAEDFLNKENPTNSVPVPIEDIVEINLKIKVVPIPDLYKIHGFDSYLVVAGEITIVIDFGRYEGMVERTRFSYAHELAHFLLHEEIYRKANIKDEEDYKKFQSSIDRDVEKRLEIQAFVLASYLLLPQDEFRNFVDKYIKLKNGNLIPADIGNLILAISDKFQVSDACVLKHLKIEYKDLMNKFYIPF